MVWTHHIEKVKKGKETDKHPVNLIGHSNGGLVSRYYVENLNNSSKVKKLITIDTPHWGSGLADIGDNLTTLYPMDVDLNPNNAIFGGDYKKYSALNPWVWDKYEYINENQTDELKYWNKGDTEYYFLAGYDVVASIDVPVSHLDKNIAFKLNLKNIDDFGEYKEKFRDSFVDSGTCSELVGNRLFENVFNLKSADGDNVVNNQSQLGLKFDDDKDTSDLIKRIDADHLWINIDTFLGHNPVFHFHGQNQKRVETVNQIQYYLEENF